MNYYEYSFIQRKVNAFKDGLEGSYFNVEYALSLADELSSCFAQEFEKEAISSFLPNQETLKTFKDSDAGKNLVESESAEEMFDKLENEK